MHIAASSPLALDKDNIQKDIINKELEIIKAEIANTGKPAEMIEKISSGKLSKFSFLYIRLSGAITPYMLAVFIMDPPFLFMELVPVCVRTLLVGVLRPWGEGGMHS